MWLVASLKTPANAPRKLNFDAGSDLDIETQMRGKTKKTKEEISPVFKGKQNTRQFAFFVFNVQSILK